MNNGVKCDQTVTLSGLISSVVYPKTLRFIHYYESGTKTKFNFLTNNFTISAQTIADIIYTVGKLKYYLNGTNNTYVSNLFSEHPKHCQNKNLDCSCCLFAGGYYQKNHNIDTSLYNILPDVSLTLLEKNLNSIT